MRPPNCLFVMVMIVVVAVEAEDVVAAAAVVVEGVVAAARPADVPVAFAPPVAASGLPSS